jgi:hypothetical protein
MQNLENYRKLGAIVEMQVSNSRRAFRTGVLETRHTRVYPHVGWLQIICIQKSSGIRMRMAGDIPVISKCERVVNNIALAAHRSENQKQAKPKNITVAAGNGFWGWRCCCYYTYIKGTNLSCCYMVYMDKKARGTR